MTRRDRDIDQSIYTSGPIIARSSAESINVPAGSNNIKKAAAAGERGDAGQQDAAHRCDYEVMLVGDDWSQEQSHTWASAPPPSPPRRNTCIRIYIYKKPRLPWASQPASHEIPCTIIYTAREKSMSRPEDHPSGSGPGSRQRNALFSAGRPTCSCVDCIPLLAGNLRAQSATTAPTTSYGFLLHSPSALC